MNPFDLPGPEFLVFFAACISVLAGALLVLSRPPQDWTARIDPRDPYLIAYLRGGRLEALTTAIVSLLDRGLLRLAGSDLETVDPSRSVKIAGRPIEKSILDGCRTARPLDSAFEVLGESENPGWVNDYDRTLTRAHLLPDTDDLRTGQRRFLVVSCLLWGIALTKIMIAFSRGRHNVLYLMRLALGGTVLFYVLTHPRRTPEGRAALRRLRAQFRSLPRRAREIRMVRRRRLASAGSGWSGWGAGCGSGCGGGGCGGGCGGCGG